MTLKETLAQLKSLSDPKILAQKQSAASLDHTICSLMLIGTVGRPALYAIGFFEMKLLIFGGTIVQSRVGLNVRLMNV